jgi:hypothetical protein
VRKPIIWVEVEGLSQLFYCLVVATSEIETYPKIRVALGRKGGPSREIALPGWCPDLTWIEVEGWNYSAFPNGTLPTWTDLQGLTGGRPAFLVAYDYHTIWMKRDALREFGITRKTEKVIFAEKLEKDGKTGEPTGIVTEFGSTGLSEDAETELRKHLPSHAVEAISRDVANNVAAVKAGITTVVDPQSYLEDLEVYSRLRRDFQQETANLKAACTLHFAYYNFCRVHQTLRVTPAMEAGLMDHVWSLEELVGLLETSVKGVAA